MRHRALREDGGGERVELELRESRLGAVEEEGGEALEVVVRGGDDQRQRGHAAQQPKVEFGVGPVAAQKLEEGENMSESESFMNLRYEPI